MIPVGFLCLCSSEWQLPDGNAVRATWTNHPPSTHSVYFILVLAFLCPSIYFDNDNNDDETETITLPKGLCECASIENKLTKMCANEWSDFVSKNIGRLCMRVRSKLSIADSNGKTDEQQRESSHRIK